MVDRPQIGVGAIVLNDERILLVLRGKAPNARQWAIPGGRQRLGETLQEAAAREVLEETGIVIRAGEVIYTTELIERNVAGTVDYHYVILDLAADYVQGVLHAGDDALDARWVAFSELEQLPVNASTSKALKHLYPEKFI